MIYLYQAPRGLNAPNLSPFCSKLELYLRMTKRSYEVRPWNPRKAPKGKMPYVVDEDHRLADSKLIIEHYEEGSANKLDAWLSPQQKAMGHCVTRMLEEGTYFCGLRNRWMPDENFQIVSKAIISELKLPKLMKGVLPHLLRRRMQSYLHGQGTGRHSDAEVKQLARQDFEAVFQLMNSNGPYYFGEHPSTIDCTVYGFAAALFKADLPNPLLGKVSDGWTRVATYLNHIESTYFADLQKSGALPVMPY